MHFQIIMLQLRELAVVQVLRTLELINEYCQNMNTLYSHHEYNFA